MSDIKPIETIYNGYRFRSRLEARWAVFFDALHVEYEYEPEGFQLPSGKYYLPDFRVKCHGTRGGWPGWYPDSIYPCFQCKHYTPGSYPDVASWFNGFCDFFDAERDWKHFPSWLETRDSEAGEIIRCEKKEPHKPFDLYVEVKGRMTQDDADRIREFAGCGYRTLIVGNIPDPETYDADSDNLRSYEGMDGIRIYPWNYETIDGDYFAAYPAAISGHFYLDGDDSNYQTMPIYIIRNALRAARQARFEHGEKPTI